MSRIATERVFSRECATTSACGSPATTAMRLLLAAPGLEDARERRGGVLPRRVGIELSRYPLDLTGAGEAGADQGVGDRREGQRPDPLDVAHPAKRLSEACVHFGKSCALQQRQEPPADERVTAALLRERDIEQIGRASCRERVSSEGGGE